MSLQNLHDRVGRNLVWIVVFTAIVSFVAAVTTSATFALVLYDRVTRDLAVAKVAAGIDRILTPRPDPEPFDDSFLYEVPPPKK